ncbi:MAG: hypothetical protein JNL67_10120 [Planctomycetaceae bacterium]|nr:hypothetical protein [Planctomycetaceae bacterium]
MAESKNSPTTEKPGENGSRPERLDRAHAQFGNHPHVVFGAKKSKTESEPFSELPAKLQARMDRLLADLAALEEPEYHETVPGDLIEIRSESNSIHLPELTELEPELVPEDIVTVPFRPSASTLPASENPRAQVEVDLPEAAIPPRDQPSLADVSHSFSRQAREILEIIKRRQDELSIQKNELELREAGLEKRIRQERLALVERQRQLEQSLTVHRPPTSLLERVDQAELDSRIAIAPESIDHPIPSEPSIPNESVERRITPEWIAVHERMHGGTAANQDQHFYDVIEEFVARQVQQENSGVVANSIVSSTSNPTVSISQGRREAPSPASPHSATKAAAFDTTVRDDGTAMAAWQRQAEHLRQQHETAIRSLRQTRRQLELLKDILTQQQSLWAKQAEDLEAYRAHTEGTYAAQQQQWLIGLEDVERLRILEQNESSKRKTFLDHREAALHEAEERLQQSQVEVLRDRVILKQLERTIRQSISNADWSQRWQIISEETQSYLKKVHEEAEAIQAETKRRTDRLESRKSEMLLYRESLRSWIERQMKLVSRRVGHSEDRESVVRQASAELAAARRELKDQQDALEALFGHSLQIIDERLDAARLPSQEAA